MTPIRPQFNAGLLAMNALQELSKQNTVSGMDASVFGSNLGSLNSQMAMMNAFSQLQSFNFSMPAMPAMPAFNFNFSSMPSFNFNFGSLLTSGRTSNVSLTSDKAKNAVQLALSQVGVREVGTNSGADVTKYKNGRADNNPWCASFVSWCYGRGQNGNNSKTFGYTASSQEIRRKAEQAGFYRKASSGYTPKTGDVVVWNYGGGKGHVGIVASVNGDGSFKTVEGNCSDSVRQVTRQRSEVDGFVQMNEWLQA